eukprot:CAMPEP_0119385326 /NCGR_PEP_ID=MMETSP1334-20130426/90634_1 /TAXON_ID=127549 /ORGANISM="Calcidiscus leptoporus, Strain RCC1130" /LENGTH=63 /DNA_ID=CAMNT_0007406591 /DNA_START=349 /DNA_END=536 /DNA_ORIENTATION=-
MLSHALAIVRMCAQHKCKPSAALEQGDLALSHCVPKRHYLTMHPHSQTGGARACAHARAHART